jgi:cytoskeletal protein CcmA (bactofilin family)
VSLRISGKFQGTLQTKGDLTIGEGAIVDADITGESVTVAGKVSGKLIAKTSLTLVAPAVVSGEVWTPSLRIEEGAILDGEVHMSTQGQRMSVEDVAAYLEVDARVIEGWAREGKIAGVQEKGRWLFEKVKIDSWVASQKSS